MYTPCNNRNKNRQSSPSRARRSTSTPPKTKTTQFQESWKITRTPSTTTTAARTDRAVPAELGEALVKPLQQQRHLGSWSARKGARRPPTGTVEFQESSKRCSYAPCNNSNNRYNSFWSARRSTGKSLKQQLCSRNVRNGKPLKTNTTTTNVLVQGTVGELFQG